MGTDTLKDGEKYLKMKPKPMNEEAETRLCMRQIKNFLEMRYGRKMTNVMDDMEFLVEQIEDLELRLKEERMYDDECI